MDAQGSERLCENTEQKSPEEKQVQRKASKNSFDDEVKTNYFFFYQKQNPFFTNIKPSIKQFYFRITFTFPLMS